MNGEVRITEDVPGAFAELFSEAYISRNDPRTFSVALSGGSTARPCYEQLAKLDLDWSVVVATWGDERAVPLTHEDSNYCLAKEALLDQVTPLQDVIPLDADIDSELLSNKIAGLLPLDFVHLGMGDDGHTASLFPGSPALEAPPEDVLVYTGDDLHKHPRISFTFSALAQSRLVVFTVTGANKAKMFERISTGEHLPAGQVAAERVIWLVDPAAAGSTTSA